MTKLAAILLGAGLTIAACWSLGSLMVSLLRVSWTRTERHLYSFLLGAPFLSLIVLLLGAAHAANRFSFLAVALLCAGAAWWRRGKRAAEDHLDPLPAAWKYALLAVGVWFGGYYLVHALAPPVSPDAIEYHLGFVNLYDRAGGLLALPESLYAQLSQGLEMLFWFAFAFGRHSAAKLVHLAYLFALFLLLVEHGRRIGRPALGAAAAMLVFVTPVVGSDGATAYNDVAVACVLFAVYHLLVRWWAERRGGMLPAIGILAGFAYGLKYTAFTAAALAAAVIVLVQWKDRRAMVRSLAVVGASALVFVLPWMIKNIIVVGNPVAPFFNAWFPNEFYTPRLEAEYVRQMSFYPGLASRAEIPLEVAVRGHVLGGFLGPLWLLVPLALLALRESAGRRELLTALLFGAPFALNIGTRFLIPALPLLALALVRALGRVPFAAPAFTLLHVAACLPGVVTLYCHPHSWRLSNFPLRAALRQESETDYLLRKSIPFAVARLLEQQVPPDARVFSFAPVAQAYTERSVLVGGLSSPGRVLQDVLWTASIPARQPSAGLDFEFPEQELTGIRLVQKGTDRDEPWSVTEVRVLQGDREVERTSRWRVRAQPNAWLAPLAFDNSPVTRWSTRVAMAPGMFLEADFGSPQKVDGVWVRYVPDHNATNVKLEGRGADGQWRTLVEAPRPHAIGVPLEMRRLAAHELMRRGFGYLLVHPDIPKAEDFRRFSSQWGLQPLGEAHGAVLYRVVGAGLPAHEGS